MTPESVLFHDDQHPPLEMAALGSAVKAGRLDPATLRHADGVITRGVHLVKLGSQAVIVYLSGNEMRIADRGPTLLPRFDMLDADLFWLDYRGEGASAGQPSIETLQSDTADVMDLAAREHKPVILHGLSMGSLLAGRAAADPRVAALVLEGAVPSIALVAEATTPGWLRPLITVDIDPRLAAFNNLVVLAAYERPLLILVGGRDAETPPVLSRQLYDAARSPDKTLVVAPERTHFDAMTSDEAIKAYGKLTASLH